jgi:hypothetical protein
MRAMDEETTNLNEETLFRKVGEERSKNLQKGLVKSLFWIGFVAILIGAFALFLLFEKSGRYFSKGILLLLLDIVFLGVMLYRFLNQYQADKKLSILELGKKYSGTSLLVKGNAKKQEKGVILTSSVGGGLLLLMAVLFLVSLPTSHPDLKNATLIEESGTLVDAPSYSSEKEGYSFSLTGQEKTYTIDGLVYGEIDRKAFKANVVAGSAVTFSHLENDTSVYVFSSDGVTYLTLEKSIDAFRQDTLLNNIFAGFFLAGALACGIYAAVELPLLKKKEREGIYELGYLKKEDIPLSPVQAEKVAGEKEHVYRYKKSQFVIAGVLFGVSVSALTAGLICIPFTQEGALVLSVLGGLFTFLNGLILFLEIFTYVKSDETGITFYRPFHHAQRVPYSELDTVKLMNSHGSLILYKKDGKAIGQLDPMYQDFAALCRSLIAKGVRFPRDLLP